MRIIRIEFIFGGLIATGTATIDAISPQRFAISFKWEPSVVCRSETCTNKQSDPIQNSEGNALSLKFSNNWDSVNGILQNITNLIISNYSDEKLFTSSKNMSNGAVPFLGGRSPPYVSFYSTSGFSEPFCS